MLRRVAIIITDVSEELRASFIRVTRIGQLGTTLAVTINRPMQHQCDSVGGVNDWQRKPKYSEKTCSSAALPTRLESESNPGRRDGKPAANDLSYGTAVWWPYFLDNKETDSFHWGQYPTAMPFQG
jgi:hypothetical protein